MKKICGFLLTTFLTFCLVAALADAISVDGTVTADSAVEVYAPIGENWSVTIEASAEAELSYQWYFKSVNTTEWKASGMTGCKTATITVPVTAARIGQAYKCVITAEDGGKATLAEFGITTAPDPVA